MMWVFGFESEFIAIIKNLPAHKELSQTDCFYKI